MAEIENETRISFSANQIIISNDLKGLYWTNRRETVPTQTQNRIVFIKSVCIRDQVIECGHIYYVLIFLINLTGWVRHFYI